MKILYIEDEVTIAKPVKRVLEAKGFLVDYFDNGHDGLKAALVNVYNCILLDLNLPGVDGFSIAKKLKTEKVGIPIIMITARSNIEAKLTGFDLGADDYITKPFEIEELIARINLRIRKSFRNAGQELYIQDALFEPNLNLIKSKKRTIVLSNKESAILELLMRNSNNPVSAYQMLEQIWDTNIEIETDTVKTHIKTLRKKLGKLGKFIKTIKGKGYLFYED